MSLITRCPACQTSFRVVPDQLRMSEGWVRCGQCSDIFDAQANLQTGTTSNSPDGDVDLDVEVQADAQRNAEVDVDIAVSNSPVSSEIEQIVATDVLDLQTALREVVASRASRVDTSAAALESPPSGAIGKLSVSTKRLPDGPAPSATDEIQTNETQEGISFLGKGKSQSAKQKTWVKVTLAILGLVLLVALGVQALVFERNRLASFFPDLKPHLQTLCTYLNCTVSTLKQVESIVVDNSTFGRQRGDTYRFGLVLKNTAVVELAMPAIELTLTDSQDQPLLRKVLTATDLGAKTDILAANTEWTGAVVLNAKVNGGAERISGYRVLAFYP